MLYVCTRLHVHMDGCMLNGKANGRLMWTCTYMCTCGCMDIYMCVCVCVSTSGFAFNRIYHVSHYSY